jgi:hypothetical protein
MPDRSRFACPKCGEHQLAVIEFPDQRTVGFEPANEIIGMGEPIVMTPPAIGCLSCGAEWPSLEAFRAEVDGTTELPNDSDDASAEPEHHT